jgi:hypothetical protein
MTSYEHLQIIVGHSDRVSVHASASSSTASLSIATENSQKQFCLSLGLEQIPQVEELLNLLWAMKDEADGRAQQRIKAIEEEWADTRDFVTADEF